MIEREAKKKAEPWQLNLQTFNNSEVNPFGDEVRKERKFNLKLRKTDVELMDTLAMHYKVPRSVLINRLLLSGLIHELRTIESDDPDALAIQALIASRADEKLREISFQRQAFWVEDVLSDYTKEHFDELMTKNKEYLPYSEVPMSERHSQIFNALYDFFQGIDNK